MFGITSRKFSTKIFQSSKDAIADIHSGSSLLVGGFGLGGIPENLIRAVHSRDDISNLTVYSNNCGIADKGLALLVRKNQIKRMCLSFIGGNEDLEKKFLKGEIELEMIPQGSLAEKLRAGGSGIPAFYTRTGFGTIVEKGGVPILMGKDGKTVLIQSEPKETKLINGKDYILEPSGEKYEKAIEKITSNIKSSSSEKKSDAQIKREKIAKRAARELRDGMYVNLGIGIPTLVSNYVKEGINVQLHAENGMLGTGEYPDLEHVDADLINASKETITEKPGCSYFSSSDSFSIVRGSHISLTILGGMQVDQNADLANWIIPNKLVRGMGGAMDLVSSNSKVLICMEHSSKNGDSKILKKCKLPITGKGCVWKIITDLAVFEFVHGRGLVLQEIFEDTTLDKVKSLTEADFTVDANLKSIKL